MDDRWIPEAAYKRISAAVPIVCVDLLPMSQDGTRVGLILRNTYEGGQGWCLLGGGVLINESLQEALARHVATTLGGDASISPGTIRYGETFEYFSVRRAGELYDPRKHAVALTYSGEVTGKFEPQDEALDFDWFSVDSLPDAPAFGFGQDRVVHALLTSRP
jgi:ADP-ribose pyrophosphatase YjhB (NUDIX family)